MATQISKHFYLKKSIIHLRLTLNGERCEISTHKKIDPEIWDGKIQKVKGKSDYAKAINMTLINLLGNVEKLCISREMRERIVLQSIVDELKGNDRNQMTLFKAYEDKHLFPGKSPILLTDGCNFVKEVCNAYWLFDAIQSYQPDKKISKINFQVWELQRLRKDLSWLLTCREDIGKKPLIYQSIEFSDFPLDYIKIWLIDKVAVLPSEY